MGWMGPVVDGQEHEGWVVPLFADGAQGAGTSSARGLLIARRPDDGPCNGDRVRLTYRDGSTAEGLWQGGTLIRSEGIVHSHTGGQVRLEVLTRRSSGAWTPRSSAGPPAAPAAGAARPGPAYYRSSLTPRRGGWPPPARGPIWRPPMRTGS